MNVEIAWRYSSIDLIYRAHDVYSSCRSFHSYCGARKVDAFPAEPGMMIQGGRHGYTRKFKMHMEDFKKKRFLQSTILLRFLPYFPGNFGAGPWDPMGFCLQTVPTQVVLCFAGGLECRVPSSPTFGVKKVVQPPSKSSFLGAEELPR